MKPIKIRRFNYFSKKNHNRKKTENRFSKMIKINCWLQIAPKINWLYIISRFIYVGALRERKGVKCCVENFFSSWPNITQDWKIWIKIKNWGKNWSVWKNFGMKIKNFITSSIRYMNQLDILMEIQDKLGVWKFKNHTIYQIYEFFIGTYSLIKIIYEFNKLC